MLDLKPLCTVIVDVAPPLVVGAVPGGDRSIGEFKAATVIGERINATLAGPAGADWILRNGRVGKIDVRMTLKTDDGALIYVSYGGRLLLAHRDGPVAVVAPTFETGDERYAWLNDIQAIGRGTLTAGPEGARLHYEFYEVL